MKTSFQAEIRPLFTEEDIRAMSKAFNLANHDDIKLTPPQSRPNSRGRGGRHAAPTPERRRSLAAIPD